MRRSAFAALGLIIWGCSSNSADPPPVAASTTPTDPTSAAADASASDATSAEAKAPSACAMPLVGKVSLPTDDTAHPKEPMEWWYWTGHLETADGRWFGFEEVFFRVLVLGLPGHMVHSALTDIQGNAFHHYASVLPGDLAPSANGFAYSESGHSVTGGNGHDSLVAHGSDYSLALNTTTTRRATLQHGDGYTNYSFGGYTYYYSRERMDATGTVSVGGQVFPVTGTAWFDHQYGDIQMAVNRGWDWFAFQLDDGREMMLFAVRVHGKQVFVGASVTSPGCETIEVPAAEVAVASTGSWKSPHTLCTYPQGWTVKVGAETFTIAPYVADQEVSTSTPIYWEGASKITNESGAAVGRAYVELSGYCPNLQ